MSTLIQRFGRPAIGAALLVAAAGACAHVGTGAHVHDGSDGLLAGLGHPFGADHLLAMVAVGVWSAAAFRGARRTLGPLVFLAALAAGALLGTAAPALPGLELALAASVVLMGALLAGARQIGAGTGLALVAAAAVLHGLAHGAELPATGGFAGYAAGFLLTTAALHAAGLGLGARLAAARPLAWRVLGALVGGAGLLLLARI